MAPRCLLRHWPANLRFPVSVGGVVPVRCAGYELLTVQSLSRRCAGMRLTIWATVFTSRVSGCLVSLGSMEMWSSRSMRLTRHSISEAVTFLPPSFASARRWSRKRNYVGFGVAGAQAELKVARRRLQQGPPGVLRAVHRTEVTPHLGRDHAARSRHRVSVVDETQDR